MNDTPIPLLQPKQRFQTSGNNISEHRSMVETNSFQRGLDYAFLQYAAFLQTQTTDGNSAMACGFKLAGAQEFMLTLKALSESVSLPRAKLNDNLDHKA